MNPKDIVQALNDVDPALVQDSEVKKRRSPLPWVAAACLALVLAGVAIIQPWQLHQVNLGGMNRLYRGRSLSHETALIFPWEYQPVYERYNGMAFEGIQYRTRAKTIDRELLTEELGLCQVSGYDIYTDTTTTAEYPVYGIRGIGGRLLVAVQLDESYYVFMQEEYAPPATLGDFLTGYSLPQVLPLEGYYLKTEKEPSQYRCLTGDSAEIWALLSLCRDAPYVEEDPWYRSPEGTVSFAATSQTLGIYKKTFGITPDGYLVTNIMEWGYTYDIGTEAAAKILAYVSEHSEPAEAEPYEYRLAGVITEIGDGYFLLDDGILAANGKGVTFRVSTEDLIISRWLDFGGIGLGDLVVVSYTGGISQDGTNTVCDPTRVSAAILSDGSVLVPE